MKFIALFYDANVDRAGEKAAVECYGCGEVLLRGGEVLLSMG